MRDRIRPTTAGTNEAAAAERDRGSLLTIVMVLVIVGGLVVGGLLTFTSTVLRARPPLEERTRGVESAKSAMRLAIMMQVSKGPSGCISQSEYPAGTFDLNGFTAAVTCTPLAYFDTGRQRYGVITTHSDPARGGLVGFNGAPSGQFLKDVDGDVFLNGGNLTIRTSDVLVAGTSSNPFVIEYSNSVDLAPGAPGAPGAPVPPPLARYRFGAAADVDCDAAAVGPDGYPVAFSQIESSGEMFTHVHQACSLAAPVPWWTRAGDDPNPTDPVAQWQYPRLPQVPVYDRDGKYVDLTPTCRMYYPGRYENPLVVSGAGGRQHFFASGIYHFLNTLTITDGARVVFGEGRVAGCAVDSDLALSANALTNHSITGKGATILLDGPARLVVQRSSVMINRRVSTPATRGSEGVSIRTVNLGVARADLQVPSDIVQQGEYPCVQSSPGVCATPFLPDTTNSANAVDVGVHQVLLPTVPTPTALRYTGSTLASTDPAVLVDFTATASQAQSQFEAEGYVFTPNAAFVLRTPNSGGNQRAYRFVMKSGVVASSVELDAAQLPTNPAQNWFLGVEAQPTQLRVGLVARVTGPSGRQSTSRAIVEVRANNAYAVNSWTVDPDQLPPPTTVPPTTTTTTTTTTPTTTTTTPTTTTTTTMTTTTTTTTTTTPPSSTSTTSTTTTTTTMPPTTTTTPGTCPSITGWRGEYFNNMNLSGSPVMCRNDASINFNWGSGGPGGGLPSNAFSARWTRIQTFAAGTYTFTVGSDDGARLYIDGVLVLDWWDDHAYSTRSVTRTLPAGSHTIRMEYYENGGQARATLTWST